MDNKTTIVASIIIGASIATGGYFLAHKGPTSYEECVLEYGRGFDSGLGRADTCQLCRALFPRGKDERISETNIPNPFLSEGEKLSSNNPFIPHDSCAMH